MEVSSKLEAVVAPADQVAPTPGVTVMLAPVTRPVTVALAHVTRAVRGAAPSSVIVSTTALFPCAKYLGNKIKPTFQSTLGWLQPDPFRNFDHWSVLNWWRLLTAVILLMVVVAKLPAVVAPTHEVPPAPPVSVVLAPVPRPVTVALALVTRVLRCAASPVLRVTIVDTCI